MKRVRGILGKGGPNTIGRLLKEYFSNIGRPEKVRQERRKKNMWVFIDEKR